MQHVGQLSITMAPAVPATQQFYGRALTRDEIVDMRLGAEESLNTLYTKMLDYIGVLEGRVRNLERKNRELRGQLGKVG